MNPPSIQTRHILTPRTARYFVAGTPGQPIREVVYAFHGYGQLAERFIGRFGSIVREDRVVVAPEGLSRFYLRSIGAPLSDVRVGASWMTREDRENEIDDQLRYLDALHASVMVELDGVGVAVSLLGFSQGVATAARWLARGSVRATSFVAWAGRLPAELDADALAALLRDVSVHVVVGNTDELASAEVVEQEADRLHSAGVAHERHAFEGGHELNDAILGRIYP